MCKAGIVITPRMKRWHAAGRQPEIPAPPNALAPLADQTAAGAWVQDFTYLWFHGAWLYLAVVQNLKTRQVIGWQLDTRHTSELTSAALLDALSKHSPPAILHSDQGSEYLSHKHRLLCEKLEITLSCSAKSSPWQNGFMESFFGRFKDDLGPVNIFADLSKLHEAIAFLQYGTDTQQPEDESGGLRGPAQATKGTSADAIAALVRIVQPQGTLSREAG